MYFNQKQLKLIKKADNQDVSSLHKTPSIWNGIQFMQCYGHQAKRKQKGTYYKLGKVHPCLTNGWKTVLI